MRAHWCLVSTRKQWGGVTSYNMAIEDVSTMVSDIKSSTRTSRVFPRARPTLCTWQYGPWRYYSVGGAGGTIATVSPGYNGAPLAVSLSRSVAYPTGDTAIDLWNDQPVLQANHQYHVQVWAY